MWMVDLPLASGRWSTGFDIEGTYRLDLDSCLQSRRQKTLASCSHDPLIGWMVQNLDFEQSNTANWLK